jgi:hypothetical protein
MRAVVAQGSGVRDCIDASRQAGDDGESGGNARLGQLGGAAPTGGSGLASSDYRDTAGVQEIPVALEGYDFEGIDGVAQTGGIVGGAVDSEVEVFESGGAALRQREARVCLDVMIRDKLGRQRAGMLAEDVSDGIEPGALPCPQRFVGA